MWVVDSGDRLRVQDCKDELHKLLTEDVGDYTVAVFWVAHPALEINGCFFAHLRQQARYPRRALRS